MGTDSAREIAIVSGHRYRAQSLALALALESSFQARVVLSPEPGCFMGVPTVLIEVEENIESALHLTRGIVQECPDTKVILLGVHESNDNVVQIAESGASGYASPSISIRDLARVIAAVQKGEFICSPPVAYTLFKRLSELASTKEPRTPEGVVLTARELHILELMSHNLSNKEIAGRLSLSTCTVKNHVHRILKKLQVRNRRNVAQCLWPEFGEAAQIGFR